MCDDDYLNYLRFIYRYYFIIAIHKKNTKIKENQINHNYSSI